MSKLNIKKGSVFNMLTVIEETDMIELPSGQKNRAFLCKCKCGNKKVVRLSHLCRGRIKSCGCLRGVKHEKKDVKLYNSYRAMKNRCSKNYSEKHLYYDRGISVCEEWKKDFSLFRSWAKENGFKEGLTIDRIDNDKGYFPENCRWVTQLVNCNNRRNTVMVCHNGENVSLSLLLHELNRHEDYELIYSRIKRGWSFDKAFNKPRRKGNYNRKNTGKS